MLIVHRLRIYVNHLPLKTMLIKLDFRITTYCNLTLVVFNTFVSSKLISCGVEYQNIMELLDIYLEEMNVLKTRGADSVTTQKCQRDRHHMQ